MRHPVVSSKTNKKELITLNNDKLERLALVEDDTDLRGDTSKRS